MNPNKIFNFKISKTMMKHTSLNMIKINNFIKIIKNRNSQDLLGAKIEPT